MRGWRRYPALYLLALFVGAALAPHHHLDPIADLLSDRPSNSGTFAQVQGPRGLDDGVHPGRMVEDESCFACFHSDFVASPAIVLALTHSLEPLAHSLRRRSPRRRSPSSPRIPAPAALRPPPDPSTNLFVGRRRRLAAEGGFRHEEKRRCSSTTSNIDPRARRFTVPAVALGFFSIALAARAADEPGCLSLSSAISIAETNGFDSLTAEAAMHAAAGDVEAARRWVNPSVSGAWLHSTSVPVSGGLTSASGYAVGGSDQGSIEGFVSGKRALKIDEAKAALASARSNREDALRIMRRETARAFYDVLLAEATERVSREVAGELRPHARSRRRAVPAGSGEPRGPGPRRNRDAGGAAGGHGRGRRRGAGAVGARRVAGRRESRRCFARGESRG